MSDDTSSHVRVSHLYDELLLKSPSWWFWGVLLGFWRGFKVWVASAKY